MLAGGGGGGGGEECSGQENEHLRRVGGGGGLRLACLHGSPVSSQVKNGGGPKGRKRRGQSHGLCARPSAGAGGQSRGPCARPSVGAGRQPGSAGPAGDLGGARKRAVQGTARTGQGAKPPGAPYLPTGPLSRGAATALAVPGRSACWSPRTHACHAQGQARRGRLAHSREANASAEDARGTGTRRGSSSPSGFKKKNHYLEVTVSCSVGGRNSSGVSARKMK